MDDQNEIRRLRAAADRSRFLQRVASGGFLVAVLCVNYANNDPFRGTWLGTLLVACGIAIFVGSFFPFFSAKCPSCRKRFNSVGNFFRSSDSAACTSCGFKLHKHIPRYGGSGGER